MSFADRDELILGGPHDGRDATTIAHWLMVMRYDPNLTDPDELTARIEVVYPNLDQEVLSRALDYLQDLLAGKRTDRWGHA
jgi:hypothetical protein